MIVSNNDLTGQQIQDSTTVDCSHKADGTNKTSGWINLNIKSRLNSTKKILRLSHKVGLAVYNFFKYLCYQKVTKPIGKVVNYLKLSKIFDVLIIPFNLINIIRHLQSFSQSSNGKIDLTLDVAKEMKDIKDNATNFNESLENASGISIKLIKVSSALYIVSSVLTLTSTISNYRMISKLQLIKNQIEQIGKLQENEGTLSLKRFQDVLAFLDTERIKDKQFVEYTFECDQNQLDNKLKSVESEVVKLLESDQIEENTKGEKLLYQTVNSLKNRVNYKINSYRLKSLSSVIGVLCSSVFLAYSWMLSCAFGSAVNIGSFGYTKFNDYRFTRQFDITKKWYEWIF